MALDRNSIERRDFPAARRGYDPDEVDRHLREISEQVEQIQIAQQDAPAQSAPTVAAAAAEQVRTIVEAAERSASDIADRADEEGRRITDEASRAARESRERSDAETAAQIRRVEQATAQMLQRAESVDQEVTRLLDDIRAASDNIVGTLKGGASSLQSDLEGIRLGLGEIGDVKPEPVAAPEAPVEEEPIEEEEIVEEEVEEEPLAATDEGSEGARLIALNMALNGTAREETGAYLDENFDLDDREAILDDVYSRVG